MNLKALSDLELHRSTTRVANEERRITLELLKYLNEVERRKLFAQHQVSSLHSYCVKYLKLSEGQAGRRVRAARLLREIPSVETKLETGNLNLSSVCSASGFFQKEAAAGQPLSSDAKAAILSEIENLSARAVDKALMSKTTNPENHLPESVKQKTATLAQLKTTLDEEAQEDLKRLREIWSHAMPNASLAKVIKRALKVAREKEDPMEKAKRAVARAEKRKSADKLLQHKTSSVGSDVLRSEEKKPGTLTLSFIGSKFSNEDEIPAHVKHAVRVRDGDQCTDTDFATGEMCGSRWQLEFDHEIPRSVGGPNTVENIRMRCRNHNQYAAAKIFGAKTTRFWRRH